MSEKLPTAQVRQKIQDFRRKLQAERVRHENAVKKLQAAIFAVQENECVHGSWTFYPDPSGNNDSFHECDTCGRERHRKPCC